MNKKKFKNESDIFKNSENLSKNKMHFPLHISNGRLTISKNIWFLGNITVFVLKIIR